MAIQEDNIILFRRTAIKHRDMLIDLVPDDDSCPGGSCGA